MSERTVIKFPLESNIRYLPLVYLLPPDLIERRPTLRRLPRNLSVLSASNDLMDLIETDSFFVEIADAIAALVFPNFGFGGWKEHYTGNCPVWRLTYVLPLWAKLIEQETGWGVQTLLRVPANTEIPFLPPERTEAIMARIVARAIEEQGWQPILDVVREMPCAEDFENWRTNVRINFERKWYHTRSKKVQSVSLEECLKDNEHGVYDIPDTSQNVEARVIANDFKERFLLSLSEKDRRIVQLRYDGYTYEEIAKEVGYKTHSAVIKRMEAVKEKFIAYQRKQ